MRDLAPNITRQRLLIEGLYSGEVGKQQVLEYLTGVSQKLELRTYGEPIIHSPGGDGRQENQGFDAFIPLIDSGIALYVWTESHFFSTVIYTCKSFDSGLAISYTREFFKCSDIASTSF